MKELPRAILIDLDDTILDDSGSVEGCWADACAEAGVHIPSIDAETLQIAIRAHGTAWWSEASRHQRGRLDLRAASREIVREVFEELGYDVDFAADVANHYRDLRDERVCPLPGAIQTLEWLRANGVKLGIMTNGGPASQRPKIEKFALAPYFDEILIEGEFGCGKPDRRVFAHLLDALRVGPGDTWAIGDNIEADVFGAMDAGIHAIWVDAAGEGVPERYPRRPDRIVASICDLRNGREHG